MKDAQVNMQNHTTSAKVLVAPLNWGLGHATRCMPIIDSLLAQGAKVLLGGDGHSLLLLRQAYPDLNYTELPTYGISYGKGRNLSLRLLRQVPRILRAIRTEHRALGVLVSEQKIDAIISDNRYGLWHKDIPSVVVCHQLAILPPPWAAWTRSWIYQRHLRFLNKFDQLWIPDASPEPALAGDLVSRFSLPAHAHWIGTLSRFSSQKSTTRATTRAAPTKPGTSAFSDKIDILIVLSGLEPQRTLLEKLLISQAKKINRQVLIIQGKPQQQDFQQNENITTVSHLNTPDLAFALQQAKVVISRSGYSSLMDYQALGISKVILIPTPGQSEQEYLARRLAKKGLAYAQDQNRFDLKNALKLVQNCNGFEQISDKSIPLEKVITNLLKL